jgi:hypothetical protein
MDGEAVKVLFRGPNGEVETLWANRVAPGRFALDNLPWFAYGVSLGDVVAAEPDNTGMLVFTRVVEKSGNRTLRSLPGVDESTRTWTVESRRLMDALVERGCSLERANPSFVSINVPPSVALDAVAELLTASGFEWEYADPTEEDLFPDERNESGAPDV